MLKSIHLFKAGFVKLSDSSNRAMIHAGLLLAGAAVILAGAAVWQMPGETVTGADKLLHYRFGQLFAAAVFYVSYLCIVVRVLVFGRRNRSLTAVLLWVPLMILIALFLSFAVVLILAVLKELFDLGRGSFSWADLSVSLDGALTLAPSAGLIMALTPLFIPLDILFQIPRLILADVRTGINSVDVYVRESASHRNQRQIIDVLVIEDDIQCAALVMKVCRKLGLRCFHVSSASEGLDFLYEGGHGLRLVILDNFLRVGEDGHNMTGSDWLKRVNLDFPQEKREFSVVMTSGHTDLIGNAGALADLVLQKPWSTGELIGFMQQQKIVSLAASTLEKEVCAVTGTPTHY